MLEQRALSAGVSFDAMADEYMRELVRTLPIDTPDRRFALPSGPDVFG